MQFEQLVELIEYYLVKVKKKKNSAQIYSVGPIIFNKEIN